MTCRPSNRGRAQLVFSEMHPAIIPNGKVDMIFWAGIASTRDSGELQDRSRTHTSAVATPAAIELHQIFRRAARPAAPDAVEPIGA